MLRKQSKDSAGHRRPIGTNWAFYNIALVAGEVRLPGSRNPYDAEWPEAKLGRLVMALESEDRWVVLGHEGREVARLPVPQTSAANNFRAKGRPWIEKTLPLLKQGRCG
jgi:hypothetical protein